MAELAPPTVNVSVSDIKTELLSASLKSPNTIPKLGESAWNQSGIDNVQCEHQQNYSNSNSTKIHIPYEPEITVLGLEGPQTNESQIWDNLNAKSETTVIEQVRSNERHKRFKHGTRARDNLDAMTGVTTLGRMHAQEMHTWLYHGNRNIQTKDSEIIVFDQMQLKEKQTCLLYQHIGDWDNIDEYSGMTTMEKEQAQENQTCPQLGAWSTLEEETGSDVFEEYPEFGRLLDQMPAEPTIPKQTKRMKLENNVSECLSCGCIEEVCISLVYPSAKIDDITTLHVLRGDEEAETGISDPIRRLKFRCQGM